VETRSRSYDSPKAVQVARSGPFSSDFHWCTRLTHFYTFPSETHFHVTWGCHGLFWRVGWPVTCFAKYICDEGHRTPNLCGLKIVLCVRIFLEPKNLHALLPEYHHVSLKAHFLHTMMILIKIPCFFSIRAEESPRNSGIILSLVIYMIWGYKISFWYWSLKLWRAACISSWVSSKMTLLKFQGLHGHQTRVLRLKIWISIFARSPV
jgi:hypothetical protein